MLFIYLLEDHRHFPSELDGFLIAPTIGGFAVYKLSGPGEVMAGRRSQKRRERAQAIREIVREMGFSCLPFDEGAVAPSAGCDQ